MTTKTNDKPIAKSLHTITVLVQVAGHFRHQHNQSVAQAMKAASKVLGMDGREDPYGLLDKARALLEA